MLGPAFTYAERQFFAISGYADSISFFLYLSHCHGADMLLRSIPKALEEKAALSNVDLSILRDRNKIDEKIALLTDEAWLYQRQLIQEAKADNIALLPLFRGGQTDMTWNMCCGFQHAINDLHELVERSSIYDLSKGDLPFLAELSFFETNKFCARVMPMTPEQRTFLDLLHGHPLNQIIQYSRYFHHGTAKDIFNGPLPLDQAVSSFDKTMDDLRERLDRKLINFETGSAYSLRVPRGFLEDTSHMSPHDAGHALRLLDQRYAQEFRTDLLDGIGFVRCRTGPDGETLEPHAAEDNMVDRYLICFKPDFGRNLFDAKRALPAFLKTVFSDAVTLSDPKGMEVSVGWHCTDRDLRLIDRKTIAIQSLG